MKVKSKLTTPLILAGLLGLAGPSLDAQSLPVANCAISTSASLPFGGYSVFNTSPTDSTASLTFVCTGVAGPVTISLTGTQPDGTRSLKNGADMLAYNVFSDAARTQPWGDGTSGSSPIVFSKPVDGALNTVVMYGRIPARQDVAWGLYSDSFVTVINF